MLEIFNQTSIYMGKKDFKKDFWATEGCRGQNISSGRKVGRTASSTTLLASNQCMKTFWSKAY
jgi:hypothetical protein